MPFSSHDVVSDSPINNFATLNSLSFASTNTMHNGNLEAHLSSTNSGAKPSIVLPKSGSWYIEFYALQVTGSAGYSTAGVMEASKLGWHVGPAISHPQSYSYDNSNFRDGAAEVGQTSIFTASNHSYNSAFGRIGTGGVYGLLYDADSKRFSILHNTNICSVDLAYDDKYDLVFHVSQSYGDATDKHIFNFGQDHTFAGEKTGGAGATDANGIGQFYYQPPAGALALCTQNIPSGPINIANDDVPSDYFKAVYWTGNNQNPRSITGVGFRPDLIIAKRKNAEGAFWTIDSVRGAQRMLATDNKNAEDVASPNGSVESFDSDGFSLRGNTTNGNLNNNATTHVAWCWKAAGEPDENTANIINADGSLITMSTADLATSTDASTTPSKVSANRQSGFSIVKYTGDLSGNGVRTVPHGLNHPPELVITKRTDGSSSWTTQSPYLSSAGHLLWLDANSAENNNNAQYGNRSFPDSNVFSTSHVTGLNVNGHEHIAYCWHSVPGYSKIGSYTGNGNADGPFVYTGFKPAWVMVKRTDEAGAWIIKGLSEVNPLTSHLNIAGPGAEYTTNILEFDFLSNGYKIRNTDAGSNADTGTFIYIAFAEQPFKYANAR